MADSAGAVPLMLQFPGGIGPTQAKVTPQDALVVTAKIAAEIIRLHTEEGMGKKKIARTLDGATSKMVNAVLRTSPLSAVDAKGKPETQGNHAAGTTSRTGSRDAPTKKGHAWVNYDSGLSQGRGDGGLFYIATGKDKWSHDEVYRQNPELEAVVGTAEEPTAKIMDCTQGTVGKGRHGEGTNQRKLRYTSNKSFARANEALELLKELRKRKKSFGGNASAFANYETNLVATTKGQAVYAVLAAARAWLAGDTAAEEAALREAVAADPKNANSWFSFAFLLKRHKKDFDGAEDAYRKVLELFPRSSSAWYNLGILLEDHKKNIEGAKAAYHKALKIHPEKTNAWINLGLLLQNHEKDFDGAEAAYRRALKINPGKASAWLNLGILLDNHRHDFDGAEAACCKALEIDPQYANAWYNLAVMLMDHKKDVDGAEAACRKAVVFNPEHTSAWYNLGNLLRNHKKNIDGAEAAYRKVIAIDPNHSAAIWIRGLLE